MGKIITEYYVRVPDMLIEKGELQKLEPITLSNRFGKATININIPEQRHTQSKRKFDTLIFRQEVASSNPLSEEAKMSVLNDMEPYIEEIIPWFLRLMRRRLQVPIFIDFYCDTASQWTEYPPSGPPQTYTGLAYSSSSLYLTPTIAPSILQDGWAKLQSEIDSGIDTELWEEFIGDSKAALIILDLSRATIYAAIGCEIFIKEYTEKAANRIKLSKNFWEFLTNPRLETRAIDYYDAILHLVTGHSLKNENKELFNLIERIFRARNKVMHEGKLILSKTDTKCLKDDIKAAEQAIAWVRELQL